MGGMTQKAMVQASLGLAEKRSDRHNVFPLRVVKPAVVRPCGCGCEKPERRVA